jgi:hypothetical protein
MSVRRLVLPLYCFVVSGTFLVVSYRFAFAPQGSEFLGLYLMAVTLPWSLIVAPMLARATPDVPAFNVAALLLCGVVNATLIAKVGKRRHRAPLP